MRPSKAIFLIITTGILAAYYLLIGLYLNKVGYSNQESLFYIEKAQIIFNGMGDKLRIMGLTSPILPFYGSALFSFINHDLAPVIASAIGTAVLFYIMASAMVRRNKDNFYLYLIIAIFVLHPGIIYIACSGKSVYMVLIFFFLFFLNMLKYYSSNTTFHVSIASICFVLLIFSDYKMVWLAIFFIPLVFSIAINSLNLSEKESVFRVFLSFNNSSLRRKLINKTFSIYAIIFLLPLASVFVYKMLNLTHADDFNYFIDSPYATWNIITDNLEYNITQTVSKYDISDMSILISLRVLIFCPLIVIAVYLFRHNTYHVLTLLTPFGLIEFLRIKYEKVHLTNEYYLLFLVLALLCLIYRARFVKEQRTLKLGIVVVVAVQIYLGYVFLNKSSIKEEKDFVSAALQRNTDRVEEESYELADYIKQMPKGTRILADDAVAYAIVGYVNDITKFTLPYQIDYLSAVEAPEKYRGYLLIANNVNPMLGYTQLTEDYIEGIHEKKNLYLHRIYVTDNWTLYKIVNEFYQKF
ncbi:hypothetical protein HH214_03720 [Mucilaginibacter robiniae]|uniref:Glycosyltransferase RgtA/B/C/D-like domain-containing protein n=1 Tax=Mucilaginibacter robiniae TaxID=2728022 RepID=A0A7L5DWC1_9SPHI|nr:hypothetical protein [Mucilaginibacter robiniae]QJD95051.1 hypothetical protein HH214_03720 [Mucilaginibacter robiniae]